MYGSKIANLLKLQENKINVPEFDIVKWEDRNNKIDIKKYKGKYAVRSCSNIEDGLIDSFAGQFDTYLNVEKKDIERKVKQCFSSLDNLNVDDYIKAKNINVSEIKMDVMIQRMVDSELSGVLFTANPQGILNESVIVVGKGLGSGVVEDRIKTTSYYYNNTDNIYYYDGVELLDKKKVKELIELSNKIKDILGEYLDIEFAISNNKIYILQARTITTLNTTNPLILDNSNIVESYPGISLPLTISFVKFVYSGVFRGVSYRVLKNQKVLDKYSSSFNNMVGSCNGRLYYKISNWYTLIKFLPLSKFIIPIWQDMLGVKNKTVSNEKIEIPFITRIKTYFNIISELKHVTKNMDILNEKFISINDNYNKTYNDKLSTKDTIKLFNKVKKELLDIWDITLVNDLYSFIYTGLLKKRLFKKKLSNEQVNDYISGINNIESLKPIKTLIDLAYNKDKLSKKKYKEEFNNYINLYGDRNLEELKLESETFRTNPKLLEDKINEYRVDLKKLESIHRNINKDKDNSIKEDFITRFLSRHAMIGIKNREISRLNRSRIYGMVRTMFLHIGKNLVKEKRIDKQEDIFYLEMDEIFSNKKIDYKKLINERKLSYEIYEKIPTYSRIIFTDKEFDKRLNNVNHKEDYYEENTLYGTPSSNGVVEGTALVIENINNKYDVKDKILITKMTDPGWVFLLATAKGVISEKGSILSHTAIISRELKIPSVVGVNKVTNCIKTGDYIRMDGSTGKIEILKRK